MTVYYGVIGTHTMSIGVAVCLSWESGIMEREISFESAVLSLILLTIGAVRAGAVVYVDPGGFGHGTRFSRRRVARAVADDHGR